MNADNQLEYADNPEFNQTIDEEIGDIVIYGEKLSASYILYELKYETYRIAFTDYLDRKFEDLQERTFDDYPPLIAFNYRSAMRGPGSNDSVRKFLHLKDAWEGAINILNALVFGEIRAKSITLKSAQVYHSGNPNMHFNSKIIRTDELKQRLENVRAIINYSAASSLGLTCEKHVSPSLLDNLYSLQDNRNHFSHSATPTKEQAEVELKVVMPIVNKVLEELQFMENITFLRFELFDTKCRFETFRGHHLNKDFDNINVDSAKLGYVMTNLGQVVFARWNDEFFSVSPFLHYLNDTSGYETYLCFYKGKKNGKYCYEPIKMRNEITFDHLQARFDTELQELVNLMVP
ncbi:MAG: hypothetical protein ABFD57_10535 [Smithella sp.]